MNPYRIVWGFLFLSFGLIFLLNSIGRVEWNIWITVVQFWPVLLIAFGLAFLFSRKEKAPYLLMLATFGFLFGLAALGIWQSYRTDYFNSTNFIENHEDNLVRTNISQSYSPSIEKVTAKVDFGASEVDINSTRKNVLVEGTHVSNFSSLDQSFNVNGKSVVASFKARPLKRLFSGKNVNNLELSFSEKPTYDFDLNVGASDINLNLAEMAVRNLKLNSGASKIILTLSGKDDFKGELNTGATDVTIRVPKDANVSIETKGAVNSNNFEDFGLTKRDGKWEVTGREGNNIEVDFNGAISKIKVETY